MSKKPSPEPIDRPCFRCGIIHGFAETCAKARERVAGKPKRPKRPKKLPA